MQIAGMKSNTEIRKENFRKVVYDKLDTMSQLEIEENWASTEYDVQTSIVTDEMLAEIYNDDFLQLNEYFDNKNLDELIISIVKYCHVPQVWHEGKSDKNKKYINANSFIHWLSSQKSLIDLTDGFIDTRVVACKVLEYTNRILFDLEHVNVRLLEHHEFLENTEQYQVNMYNWKNTHDENEIEIRYHEFIQLNFEAVDNDETKKIWLDQNGYIRKPKEPIEFVAIPHLVVTWVKEIDESDFIFSTDFPLPIISTPRNWTTDELGGGYVLSESKPTLNKGEAQQPQECLDILNTLQKNSYMLRDNINVEAYKEYIVKKQLKAGRSKIVAEEISKNTTTTFALHVSLLEKRCFFFQWKFDFRGRLYNTGYNIHLQSDSYKKSMLVPCELNFKQ